MFKPRSVAILAVFVFLCGFLIGNSIQYLEYGLAKFIVTPAYDDGKSENYGTDVDSLIHIGNSTDVAHKRASLIEFIWKDSGFPTETLPSIEANIVDSRFSNMDNLKQIDKITVNMEHDVNSIAYFFNPKKSNNKLIIYHQGHDGEFVRGRSSIEFFLKNNYSVLAFSMPLLGMNNQPIVEIPDIGKIRLESHDHLYLLDSDKFSSIKYFVEPIAISLNYVDKNFDFDSYYMVGISGGGWTTTLYSAIDPRITQSYSVAGSLPTYLRSSPEDLGDYEQILPELYKNANYLDLYILDSYGKDRKHIQIFNKYDPCCFAGDLFTTYENEIKNTMSKLGLGTFDVYLDDTHREHKISEHALNLIINNMDS
ncbi:hypothetical protein [Candidatus Nitrosotenuis cloacae]|uniref:hypothetical protein n=1 Tax=Candidatus Nitrosotenuis cloacae TaxID=1603555 RepID=UPI00227E6A97|nr:hypothetical protein [Candidatus Nitrosotenuis cloacae]